jgi:hypothetical protein
MATIASLCTGIVNHLARLGIPTADNLLPGASEEKIRELTAGLPFALPRSVVELYKWSEGVPVAHGTCNVFFPGFGMDSFQYMVETYHELSAAPDFPRFRCGDVQWFPIFRSGGTDFYGVRCKNIATPDGEIVYDDNEGPHRDCVTPPPVEFSSLEAMLQTLLRAYETGVYYLDDHGQLQVGVFTYNEQGDILDIDMSKFNEMARQFNPGLTRWE